MKNALFAFPKNSPNLHLLWSICLLVVIAGGLSGATGQYFWLGLPAVALVIWLAVFDFRKLFYLLMGCIPISTEAELAGGFGTDLPTEPLMILLLGVGFLFLIKNLRTLSGKFIKHPITICLLFHFSWLVLTTVLSENGGVSLKFTLAKIWYLGVFYFLAGHLLTREREVRQMIFWMLPGLIVTIGYCTLKHATLGFEFRHVNEAMLPFYRNKVMYSCLLAVIMPFLWISARATSRKKPLFKWLVFTIILCLIGIQLSYTRAAYIVILLAYFLFLILKKQKMRLAIAGAALFFVGLIGYLSANNNYLRFSPEFEKTVEHKKFGNLLEATYKLQDVSTMERVFRWVAGFQMVAARPFLGFGPGTFTFFYEKFTVTSFTTYVSNNDERSGVHCYFLMVAIEQGVAGCLIFLFFSGFVMLSGEKIYHQTTDPSRRRVLLMAWLTFVIIALLMLMNDLVETDKVGSFFWLCCALIVNVDLANRADRNGQTVENQ